MTKTPEVSVVIPVFNRPELLRVVLEGLQNQSFRDFEVLVCDDGSTESLDNVIEVAALSLPGLQHLGQPNRGPAAARNLGTRHARGEIVLYLDSDIVLIDDRLLEKLHRALEENPEWAGVEANVVPVGGVDNVLWDAPTSDSGGVYLTAAMMYRMSAVQQVGGFDECFKRAACEDVELAHRVLTIGAIGFLKGARVDHPRRRKSASYYWRKRQDWRYLKIMAVRYGFIGWPGNESRFPSLRLTYSAVLSGPGGRLFSALRLMASSPGDGLIALYHAMVAGVSGLAALYEIWFARVPDRKDYLSDD